jgi:hypothetical protein
VRNSIYREHVLFIENAFYLWRTHSIHSEHILISKNKTGFMVHGTQHPNGADQEKKHQRKKNPERNNQDPKDHVDTRSLPWCSDPLYAGIYIKNKKETLKQKKISQRTLSWCSGNKPVSMPYLYINRICRRRRRRVGWRLVC